MTKSKLTPQEIYRQRRQREEWEKTAYLPPGFFNHGNTCFMNSVLQGVSLRRQDHALMIYLSFTCSL
jgi:ubiquitin C-terminal hydrolase